MFLSSFAHLSDHPFNSICWCLLYGRHSQILGHSNDKIDIQGPSSHGTQGTRQTYLGPAVSGPYSPNWIMWLTPLLAQGMIPGALHDHGQKQAGCLTVTPTTTSLCWKDWITFLVKTTNAEAISLGFKGEKTLPHQLLSSFVPPLVEVVRQALNAFHLHQRLLCGQFSNTVRDLGTCWAGTCLCSVLQVLLHVAGSSFSTSSTSS